MAEPQGESPVLLPGDSEAKIQQKMGGENPAPATREAAVIGQLEKAMQSGSPSETHGSVIAIAGKNGLEKARVDVQAVADQATAQVGETAGATQAGPSGESTAKRFWRDEKSGRPAKPAEASPSTPKKVEVPSDADIKPEDMASFRNATSKNWSEAALADLERTNPALAQHIKDKDAFAAEVRAGKIKGWTVDRDPLGVTPDELRKARQESGLTEAPSTDGTQAESSDEAAAETDPEEAQRIEEMEARIDQLGSEKEIRDAVDRLGGEIIQQMQTGQVDREKLEELRAMRMKLEGLNEGLSEQEAQKIAKDVLPRKGKDSRERKRQLKVEKEIQDMIKELRQLEAEIMLMPETLDVLAEQGEQLDQEFDDKEQEVANLAGDPEKQQQARLELYRIAELIAAKKGQIIQTLHSMKRLKVKYFRNMSSIKWRLGKIGVFRALGNWMAGMAGDRFVDFSEDQVSLDNIDFKKFRKSSWGFRGRIPRPGNVGDPMVSLGGLRPKVGTGTA